MDNKKTSDPIAFGTDASDSWDSRIRTYRCWNQNPVPYHLAISHHSQQWILYLMRRKKASPFFDFLKKIWKNKKNKK